MNPFRARYSELEMNEPFIWWTFMMNFNGEFDMATLCNGWEL